jgi:hypothetical protein
MATYQQIQDDVRKNYGRVIKTCWIAHVKELNGLSMRRAPNRHSLQERVYPCPEDIRPLIEASLRKFGMLAKG